jgi:hypothetical protein
MHTWFLGKCCILPKEISWAKRQIGILPHRQNASYVFFYHFAYVSLKAKWYIGQKFIGKMNPPPVQCTVLSRDDMSGYVLWIICLKNGILSGKLMRLVYHLNRKLENVKTRQLREEKMLRLCIKPLECPIRSWNIYCAHALSNKIWNSAFVFSSSKYSAQA